VRLTTLSLFTAKNSSKAYSLAENSIATFALLTVFFAVSIYKSLIVIIGLEVAYRLLIMAFVLDSNSSNENGLVR
jgi:hypothetical protein